MGFIGVGVVALGSVSMVDRDRSETLSTPFEIGRTVVDNPQNVMRKQQNAHAPFAVRRSTRRIGSIGALSGGDRSLDTAPNGRGDNKGWHRDAAATPRHTVDNAAERLVLDIERPGWIETGENTETKNIGPLLEVEAFNRSAVANTDREPVDLGGFLYIGDDDLPVTVYTSSPRVDIGEPLELAPAW